MSVAELPVSVSDEINARILAVSEDRVVGFQRDPLRVIARDSGVDEETVIARIRAMLQCGVIRRVRQTLLATNLAHGALIAWQLPPEKLDAAFDFLFREDPFSGHVVVRTADPATPGASYRLWTTLKVPQGYGLEAHVRLLQGRIGADGYRIMPAKRLFVLGVGHVRRRGLEPGSRAEVLADAVDTNLVELSVQEWRVLTALKREFEIEELVPDLWRSRAQEAGVSLQEFFTVAEALQGRGVIGRFSTFLEHVKPTAGNERVTRYNALFHWRVPQGREIDAGREVGRHLIMTHAYWREGGPEFRNVNVMGVAHGLEKDVLLAHKAKIDEHLREAEITCDYTNVFWGGRSEIKPSEISPLVYQEFCRGLGVDPETMRAHA
ncbi:MAG TPA: hypothetical protein VGZ00_12425 [Candidatus Baltobacteraceae bacterium]|jgi:hypothetical protein|nr:hypothetical protein [Candidatus Baltobacteraceae bacterium]